jgi:hypothetical protein
MAGGIIGAFTLLFGWPFALIVFVTRPVVIGCGLLLLCAVGYFAVRWQSRLLAFLFFVPCVTPAAWLFLYAIDPIYIPRIWEPSKLTPITGHPDFDRTFAAAAAGRAVWTTDPEAVARTYSTGDGNATAVRVWLRRDSDSSASAVTLTSYPFGNYGNETVTFRRIQLTRSGDFWRPTHVGYAARRRGGIFWNDQ